MGDGNSNFTTSPDMIIKAINPNAAGNLVLFNQHNIQPRWLTSILHFIFKNNLIRTGYSSFHPNKGKFIYKDKITSRAITCGFILFKMVMTVMKPQLAVDHRAK